MSNQQRKSRKNLEPKDREFDQRVVEISRVTRVMAGGKRMRFRATVVLGDAKGRVGYGTRKGLDVSGAVSKASAAARKTMIRVPMQGTTIPHEVNTHYGAAHVLLKPAPAGRGVIAGGAVRIVMELAGVKDVVAKMFGSRNKLNNIKATFRALEELRPPRPSKDAKAAEKGAEVKEKTND